MRMTETLHFVKESFTGIIRNRKAALAASLLLLFAVLLLAALLLLRSGFGDIYRYIDSQLSMRLFVQQGYDAAEVAAAAARLGAVERSTVTTGDQLLKEMETFFRDKPRLLAAFEDALPDAVTFDLTADADMDMIARSLGELEAVEAVIYPQRFAEQAAKWSKLMQTYGAFAFLVMAAAGFLTVFIAIRLAWLQRHKEIRLKLLLGANPRLVAMQFMLEGLWIGLIGGIPATVAAVRGYGALVGALRTEIPGVFAGMSGASWPLALLIAAAGPALSVLASYASVRRRLRDV